MKNLKDYITETQNFLVKKKLKNRQIQYEYHPKDKYDLNNIILELLDNGITDLNCIDVSKIDDLSYLFFEITHMHPIKDIDISEWDVSNVTNMRSMFEECYEFNSDLSKWNVSKVKDMHAMFFSCENFNSDLSKWNVSNVEDMEDMFFDCKKFNSDLSLWKTNGIIFGMFNKCDALIKNNKIPKWY